MLDIASFGIEQKFLTQEFGISTKDPVSIGIKPMVSLSSDLQLIRVPFILGYRSKKIHPYAGMGLEFAWFKGVGSVSPYVTGGIQLILNPFYIDIPLSTVFRKNNTDTDMALLAGVIFEF